MVSPRAGSLTIGIRHLGNPTFGMQFMNDTETVPRDLATQQEPCKPYYTDLVEEKLPALLILQLSHRFWLLLGWEATKTHSLGLAPFPVCAPLAKEAITLVCGDQLSCTAQRSGISTFSSHKALLLDAHTYDFWQRPLMTLLLVDSAWARESVVWFENTEPGNRNAFFPPVEKPCDQAIRNVIIFNRQLLWGLAFVRFHARSW